MNRIISPSATLTQEPSAPEMLDLAKCPFSSTNAIPSAFQQTDTQRDLVLTHLTPNPSIFTPRQIIEIEKSKQQHKSLSNNDEINMIPDNDLALMKGVLLWFKNFVTKSHPKFGRDGAVCPFVKPSIENDATYLSVARFPFYSITTENLFQDMLRYRDLFLTLEPLEGEIAKLKSLVILLPDVTTENIEEETLSDFMEPLHKQMKSELLKDNLLIGQFYPGCKIPGTWSPEFFPLRSPTPLLVIRNLIETDWRFLHGTPEWEQAYKERFQDQLFESESLSIP